MRLPLHREHMRELLCRIDVNQLFHARLCIGRLGKKLPTLMRALDHQPRQPRRRKSLPRR
jgi:hypothetical protein